MGGSPWRNKSLDGELFRGRALSLPPLSIFLDRLSLTRLDADLGIFADMP